MSAFNLLNEFRPLFRLLEEPLPRNFAALPVSARNRQVALPRFNQPSVEVHEEAHRYVVEAELPGVRKEDLKVSVTEGGRALTIAGSRITRSMSNTPSESTPTPDAHTSVAGEAVAASATESSAQNTNTSTDGKLTHYCVHSADILTETIVAVAKSADNNEQQIAPSVGTSVSSSSFRFSRTVYMPERVDPAALSAKLENGVLMVEIPKAKTTESTEIPIL
jgi:HSP20 family molecular chaperone IbpA